MNASLDAKAVLYKNKLLKKLGCQHSICVCLLYIKESADGRWDNPMNEISCAVFTTPENMNEGFDFFG